MPQLSNLVTIKWLSRTAHPRLKSKSRTFGHPVGTLPIRSPFSQGGLPLHSFDSLLELFRQNLNFLKVDYPRAFWTSCQNCLNPADKMAIFAISVQSVLVTSPTILSELFRQKCHLRHQTALMIFLTPVHSHTFELVGIVSVCSLDFYDILQELF